MSNCLIFGLLLAFLSGSNGAQDDYERDFIVADFIHRDSSISPFYNSSKTTSERLREAVTRSLNRINTFNSSVQYSGEKDVVSWMIPSEEDYLMKIYTNSSKKLLVMASTRSAFTWIQCRPYNDIPYFDTTDGKNSYDEIPLQSKECRDLYHNKYGPSYADSSSDKCDYEYSYLDQIKTTGILSRAKFRLDSANNNNEFSHSFSLLFGCCLQTESTKSGSRIRGMAGLGYGDLSLISQLKEELGIKKKFSYCLHPLETNNKNKIIFGKKARLLGERVSIPFRTTPDYSPYYYLTLTHASVNDKDTPTIQKPNNMIIDSGTTVTSLDLTIFESVKSYVKDSLTKQDILLVEEDPTIPFTLCYNTRDARQAVLPDIKLYFKRASSFILLRPVNTFIQYNDVLSCMNIVPATEVAILGNVAQVDFQVEYNVNKKIIYFATSPTGCTRFGY